MQVSHKFHMLQFARTALAALRVTGGAAPDGHFIKYKLGIELY